jgi:hypothetical protein
VIGSNYAHAQEFVFHDFSDLSAFTLNGVTRDIAADKARGKALRLTNKLRQSGSAFLTQLVSIDNDASFSTYIQFRITNPMGISADGVQGADGIVFVVQTQANNVGGVGGGIGFRGIQNSVGVEFDTWPNPRDINGNHVGIDINGSIDSVVAKPIETPMNNGELWHAWVDYNGQADMLEVRISRNDSRPSTPLISHEVDLVEILGKTEVFVGFTSATGSAGNTHDIIAWNFRGYFQPIGSREGYISVIEDKDQIVTTPSQIELILDASGSMRGKTKDGELKIDIAKNVLRSIIQNLPEGLEVALRVYGHRIPKDPKGESCKDSELVVPFGADNREMLIKAIDNISPKGQTPIGRSLALLSDDFGESPGTKLVILVSDGIETCSPNENDNEYPPTVINRLQEKGFRFRVNVVGFDIGESRTREFLKTLAQKSGGHYYDAQGTKQLEQSMNKAMKVTYAVRDAQGTVVVKGVIGPEPVTVPEGDYTVVVEMDPPLEIPNVTVAQNATVQLRLYNEGGKIAIERKFMESSRPR